MAVAAYFVAGTGPAASTRSPAGDIGNAVVGVADWDANDETPAIPGVLIASLTKLGDLVDDKIDGWIDRLREGGFTPLESTSAGGDPVDGDGNPLADDLWADDEIESEDRDQNDDHAPISGSPGDIRENTERVNRAFEAAGSPKFQDVKLKTAGTVRSSDPTCRQIAMRQAKRTTSLDWA